VEDPEADAESDGFSVGLASWRGAGNGAHEEFIGAGAASKVGGLARSGVDQEDQGSRAPLGDVSGELNPSKSKGLTPTSTSEAGSLVLPASLLGANEAVEAVSDFRLARLMNESGMGSSVSVRQRRKLRLGPCCFSPPKWMKVFFTGRAGPHVGLPLFDWLAKSSMEMFMATLGRSAAAILSESLLKC